MTRDQGFPVRGEGDGLDPGQLRRDGARVRPGEAPDFLARGRVPETERVVVPGRGDVLAVGREGDGADGTLMSLELAEFLACYQVPQSEGGIVARRQQGLVVRRKSERCDRVTVALERTLFLARGGVELPDRPVVPSREQGLAIPVKEDRVHPDDGHQEAPYFLTGCHLPE